MCELNDLPNTDIDNLKNDIKKDIKKHLKNAKIFVDQNRTKILDHEASEKKQRNR
jgi:hypothetical protein